MKPHQQFVFTRTYSRWREDLLSRESYSQAVDRTVGFLAENIKQTSDADLNAIRDGMLQMEVMPSMRLFWAAGEAGRQNHIALYNCSYVAVRDIKTFSEILYILMSGTGVGFSVERQYVYQLPELKPTTGKLIEFTVEDSKAGWACALDLTLRALWDGHNIEVDYSKVRPRGARLKTMGGRASGPEPLKNLIDYCRQLFEKRRKWSRLEPIDCHDLICKIGEIVVVGGVRRSSEISLSDLEDRSLARAKVGEFWREHPQRSMANNSAVYPGQPAITTFMEEWLNLMASGSGERGIFSRSGARSSAASSGRRDGSYAFGTNPCQPAGATVLTPSGIRTFKDIEIGSVIWSGKQWTKVVNKVSTGIKSTYKFHTRAGFFYGTDNHKVVSDGEKVPVGEAETIDIAAGPKLAVDAIIHNPQDVMDGLVLGDGTVHKASNNLVLLCIGAKDQDYFDSEVKDLIGRHRTGIHKGSYEITTTITAKELPKTYARKIPARFLYASRPVAASFLRGLFSANGSIAGNRVTLKQTSLKVILDVQQMLSSLGIRSYYTVNKAKQNKFGNGTYAMKESYDLNIVADKGEFKKQIGFLQKYKQEALDAICSLNSNGRTKVSYDVKDVEHIALEEVFDITVDAPEHTYWTGGLLVSNCGEILLRDMEFCNLSEVVVRAGDTLSDLKRKVKLATMLGCFQATFTDFPFIREDWKKNCDEERLLGVSLTGLMDHATLNNVNDTAKKWLSELKHTAINEARKWSKKLNINMPAAITCVKPSGTVSQLVDCASGIHQRFSDFYIRRYRISATDPLFRLMKDQGVPAFPEVGQEPSTASTWVLEFPIASPKGCKTRHSYSAIEQLEHWKMVKDFWTEHNPSCTIFVDEHEWLEVGAWVYKNFDSVCGLSFLPKQNHVYQLAPFEEISKEEYKKRLKEFPQIDYSKLSAYEQEDNTEGAKTLACVGDRCEI